MHLHTVLLVEGMPGLREYTQTRPRLKWAPDSRPRQVNAAARQAKKFLKGKAMQDIRYPFEVVTIAASHAILQPVVAASLGGDGFDEVCPLRWVRSTDAPIRQMFCFFQ